MRHCLNPFCQQPENPGNANFCQSCGLSLLLNEQYWALRLIGQGGFGRTYLAADPQGDRCVIKQFSPQMQRRSPEQQTGSVSERFRQEAKQLERLGKHPQIPRLLNYFEQADGQYLVQEYVEGQNLAEALADRGAFGEADIRKLLHDLLPVLSFVHGHQVIHRDVKPENIISPVHQDAFVLVDFGASKFATGADLARTGTVIGSAGYVAPEQAIGRAEYASDLYSLGVTCIHLLTAIHPFDLYSVSEDTWVWRQYLDAPISDGLGQVLDKLLHRPTRQRYRTAVAVLQDLNASPLARSAQVPLAIGAAKPTHILVEPLPFLPILQDTAPPWRCRHHLSGHTGAVTSVAVSPDGFFCASGSSDRTLKLWDLETGRLIHTFAKRSLWFSGGHSDRISAVAFSPEGEMLISSSDDGSIKLWDLAAKKLIATLQGQEWLISALAVSANRLLASGGGDGVIHLWDLETQAMVGRLAQHHDRISGLVISPDGQTLISSGYDKMICLWDLRTDGRSPVADHRLINTFKGHRDRVSAIAVTPDWLSLISSSWDKTLRIWELSSGKSTHLAEQDDQINCVAVSPAGQTFASGGEDSTVRLWQLPRDAVKSRIAPQQDDMMQHSWGINALCFSVDGQTLVSGSTDETIKIWQCKA